MEPKTLSASAASMFETCEARYKASYIDRAGDIAGKAGLLGNAVHEVLEVWVKDGHHVADWPSIEHQETAIRILWDALYYEYFADTEFYADGWTMIRKWLKEQDWSDRTVISTEQKKSFDIPTSKGALRFNYIMDRLDMLEDGSIDVVDYKTVRQPITHDRMSHMIQPRAYAVAAMIEYPDAPAIWVTYDLLRYGKVSVKFDRDECVRTWKYLKQLAERIYASDGTTETLNPECRFCVRKHTCETLQSNVNAGGVLSFSDLNQVTNQLAILQNARNGLDAAIGELQELGLKYAEADEMFEWETETSVAKIKASSRRDVDSERAAKIVGPEVMARYGKIGVGSIEEILKNEDLSDSQRSQLKQVIFKKWSSPRIDIKPKTPFEDD